MTTMSNQEQTSTAPLGKALQDARLSASLTVKDVAEQLNLAVSTVRDIEGNLDNVIENENYPAIYLRGYIANYAKLVVLDKLEQFPEYQQLSNAHKRPLNLCSPVKKTPKRRLLLLLLLAVFCIAALLAVQQTFFNARSPLSPDSQTAESEQTTALKELALNRDDAQSTPSPVEVESDNAEITDVETQNDSEPVNPLPLKKQVHPQNNRVKTAESDAQREVAETNATVIESLQLTFSGDCWTEVFDANGKRLAFYLYKKGALLTVNGVAPFHLKLGDPGAVTIQY